MSIARKFYPLILLIIVIALTGVFAPRDLSGVQAAAQRTLVWSVVDTPADGFNGMFIRNCGINDLALGPDNRTFYAVSTDNSIPGTGLFKSKDAGYTWSSAIGNNLASLTPPAFFPVWNIAVAPDDVNFIIAVTDGTGAIVSGGPRMVYGSTDGGSTWTNTPLPLFPSEYISCIDISKSNAGNRDIAIGTRRIIPVTGRLLTKHYSASSSYDWQPQGLAAWTAVTSVKFSPNYALDDTLAVVSFTAGGAALHLGQLDTITPANTTWDTVTGYVPSGVNLPGPYTADNITRTGIALPSDYTGTDLTLRGCFVNLLNTASSAVFYISPPGTPYPITPPSPGRIYSIAYSGANATGILLAGEAGSDGTTALAKVWQSSNAQATTSGASYWIPTSTNGKSPTGGGGTGFANVLLAWSSDGSTAYGGTSSEDSTLGGTGWAVGQWPRSKLTKTLSDESAFQYSMNNGTTWNQIGIINTIISRLSDVAAVENAEDSAMPGGGTLYLSSLNDNAIIIPNIDSVWRSASDPLGLLWERTFTLPSSNSGAILRLPPPDAGVSDVVVFADLGTSNFYYSADSGDTWTQGPAVAKVKDISLLDGSTLYLLDDYYVRKMTVSGTAWLIVKRLSTNLLAPAHTLCNPVKGGSSKELVFVGSEGDTDTAVAWADFAAIIPEFTVLKELPMQGNVHVITDDLYRSYKNIYVGINDIANADGTIYRWTMENSTRRDSPQASANWDELEPPDRGFYGVCMLNEVLYGAWNTDIDPPLYSSGADRTLEARVKVPPPPWWDQLIDGLPLPAAPNQVEFTLEPTSLHVSSNSYNTLWAIDNKAYNFTAQEGCLWQFIDSVAKLGPWPTAPATGSFIGADPVTGRAQQIDFKWRPLRDIFGYDLLIAKDVNFTLLLSQNLQMTPVDNRTGAWVVTPTDQEDPSCWIAPGTLEAGRSYYWRVRGARSLLGTPIHSPWSPTLFFSVKPGFRVTTDYPGPTLLAPLDGVCSNCRPPIRFSWSPIKNAATYEFILANDAQLKDVIVTYITRSTAYEYRGALKPYKAYYWQVRAVSPVISDPSPVGTFSLAENNTTPQKPPATTTKPGGVPTVTDFLIWIIIVMVTVIFLLITIYVVVSRRRDE